jgi:transglutaminase-like putative cysteine protease
MSDGGAPARQAARRRTSARGPRPGASFVAAVSASFTVMTLVAASTLWPVYRSPEFVLLVVVSVAVGTAVAIAGTLLRWSSFTLLVATAAVYLLLGVPVAIPGATVSGVLPTAQGLVELVTATALGWKRLVTITLPVGSYEALLVPAFVLVLLSTVVGLSVALRSRRGELAVIAPIVVYLAGIVLGPEDAWLPVPTGIALVVVAVAWSLGWRLHRRRQAVLSLEGGAQSVRTSGHRAVASRAVAGTIVTLLVAGAVSAAVVEAAPPSAPRTVARSVVDAPFDPRRLVSPLTRLRVYEQQPAVDDTLLTVDGLEAGALLRLATLDTYDGVAYTVGSAEVSSDSGTFDRVPSRVDQGAVEGDETTLSVEVGSYEGVWLPTVGRLESIRFDGSDASTLRSGFVYNDVSGSAAVDGGLESGDSYRLEAVLPRQPEPGALEALTPGSATVPAAQAVPDELIDSLSGDVRGVDGPGARLQAALAALREDGYISHGVSAEEPTSRSGHGADRLAELFTAPVMIGDAEQYAAAAALMAGELGFPARVVMGFVPDAGTVGSDPVRVRGGDVTAWIEVDTAEYGWVSMDPVPEERPIPDDRLLDPTRLQRPESVVQPPQQEPQLRDEQTPPQSDQETAEPPAAWLAVARLVLRATGVGALALGLLASPFLAIVAVKARRRRRRMRHPDPVTRIVGGWQEFRDAAVDHGVETPASATRSEFAVAVGGSRPAVLARVADRATFAPDGPASDDADRVWSAVSDMRRSLGAGMTRRQRARAAVSLRSLRRYHGGTRPER